MIYREVDVRGAKLVTYVLSNYPAIDMNRRRAMIIICPGGGYRYCSDREAECVAIRFNGMGYNSAVLYYTTNPGDSPDRLFPKPQDELAEAIKYIRLNADELNTDRDKIAVLGFSAGGHLAASLGVFWKEYGELSKPDAMVLCYSVITSGPLAHEGTIRKLIGNDDSLLDKVSLEKQVNADTPPSFIWTTRTDHSVPYENSALFRDALDAFGIKNEFILYEGSDGHGYSLGTPEVAKGKYREEDGEVSDWPERADRFLVSVFGSRF